MLVIFVLSMLPMLELRLAIPYSQVQHLNIYIALVVSIIGNIFPIIFIYKYAHKLLVYGSKFKYISKICKKTLEKGHKVGEKLKKKVGIGVYIAILIFVAIPIPGSGVWTATLAASILELDLKKVFIAESLGAIIAGLIIAMLTTGVLKII